jgi:opacity protein-like surface antigen
MKIVNRFINSSPHGAYHSPRMRLLVVLFVSVQAIAAPALFIRAGAGHDRGRETAVRDRDCSSTNPPALFGCGFEAAGDFGNTPVFEIAAGFGSRHRVELALAHRELELDANANFTGVSGEQPVHADGRSISAMVNAAVELAPASWRLRPFVAGGAGLARNSTGAVVYSFPSIGENAVTITRGGAHTNFAWNAGLGATFDLTPSLALDLAFRHTDLGTLRSPRGTATIIRPTKTLEIEVDQTRAEVATRGVMVSLRWTR